MNETGIKKHVRVKYAAIAGQAGSCCGSVADACCPPTYEPQAKAIGYSEEQLRDLPEGANLGLGCGNPVGLASLKEGDAVLDLGSGAGIDCFLAADVVGESGHVIGVDMTPEMIERARENAVESGSTNVEFRLGEIENVPVADGSVDAIVSNCVINLSPDKRRVFEEAYRVTKPGGRLLVSDIVLLDRLPERISSSIEAYVGCIAGASLKQDYLNDIRSAGFEDIEVVEEKTYPSNGDELSGMMAEVARSIASITVRAVKSSSAISR